MTVREAVYSVPDNDEGFSTADILHEMMVGRYSHDARIDVHGYRLRFAGDGEFLPNVWVIHPPAGSDTERAIDAVNLDQFRSADAIERYILALDGENNGSASE